LQSSLKMKMRDDFAVLILTHGRPHNVKTLKMLKNANYNGRWYIVIDDEDASASEYHKLYGKNVIQFSKKEIAIDFDQGDNFNDMRAIFYARNACWGIAQRLSLKYFMQMDDDYEAIYWCFDEEKKYTETPIKDINSVLEKMIIFFSKTQLHSVAFAQNGDLMGGHNCNLMKAVKTKRKAMNTFLCDTSKPFEFIGRVNEDVNTYTASQRQGVTFMTLNSIKIRQTQTQKNKGGMTDLYRDSGTYVKSFYTVMYAPSCAKIGQMGYTNQRLHHRIDWDAAAPLILREVNG